MHLMPPIRGHRTSRSRRRLPPLLLLGAFLAGLALAAGCSGSDDEGSRATTGTTQQQGTTAPAPQERLTLLAASSGREPYERLAQMFSATPEGAGVLIEQSYANSYDQARAVAYGLPADIVAPSVAADLLPMVEAELIPRRWNAGAERGMVTNSVVVLMVRRDNPHGIRGWQDLVRPRLRLLTADPSTSGVARWALLAAYGAQLERGRTPAQARQHLLELVRNLSFEGKSIRDALAGFAGGEGDVLITSEAEALAARRKGSPLEYVVPDETILIENPVSVTRSAPPSARAFVDFLRSEAAQRVFAEEGHRPVLESARAGFEFPTPSRLFTVEKLGGWNDAQLEFFDPTIGLIAQLQREAVTGG